jgi:hypothetical protein
MEMFGRREAWPAAVLLGIGVLTLGTVLKAAQENMPLEPLWLMGALIGLYVVLAFTAGRLTWRTPVVLASMLIGHAVMALLMGWGYAAVEGVGRAASAALVHGLWDYMPGTALQFGFACVLGIIVDAALETIVPAVQAEEDDEGFSIEDVPDLSILSDAQTAVTALSAIPGVGAALLAGATAHGGGVWESDPLAAASRVRALLSRTGAGLNAFPLGQVNLLARNENGHAAAILVTDAIGQQLAHALLRELWTVGERLWVTASSEPVADAPIAGDTDRE